MKVIFVSKRAEMTSLDLRECDPEELVMMVDIDRCISCGSCQLACQLEHADCANAGPDGQGSASPFRPIRLGDGKGGKDAGTLYLPSACRHCKSPCEYYDHYNSWITCPSGKGVDENTESCDFCAERVRKGLWPACASRCAMKAIYFGYARDIVFVLGEKRLREMGDVCIAG